MAESLAIIFWSSVAVIAYTYAGYPLAIGLLARFRPHRCGSLRPHPSSVSFVIAARGGGDRINERVGELKDQLLVADRDGEIILVLDGCSDDGLLSQQQNDGTRVKIVPLAENVGKAAAISIGVTHAEGEVLAFADVRQQWADNALARLLVRFEDSQVGAVSGDLILESSDANQGVGLYWRFEKWLRRRESDYDSITGVTGAIAAVRRDLFCPIPAGTILDDVYWPIMVVMRGMRVVHDSTAVAFDRLPNEATSEFRRKVRTLAGNFQLLTQVPGAVMPWKNRAWVQFVSHKILRLVVPWALLGVFCTTAMLQGFIYEILFQIQVILYAILIIGALFRPTKRPHWISAGISFAMLNIAAWVAFWVWISGNASKSWNEVRYPGRSDVAREV